jgi:hypothetical protein
MTRVEAVCPLCKQPVKVGELGVNLLMHQSYIRRCHPQCVEQVKNPKPGKEEPWKKT